MKERFYILLKFSILFVMVGGIARCVKVPVIHHFTGNLFLRWQDSVFYEFSYFSSVPGSYYGREDFCPGVSGEHRCPGWIYHIFVHDEGYSIIGSKIIGRLLLCDSNGWHCKSA